MTRPTRIFTWMFGFLAGVGALGLLLAAHLWAAFAANPFFNGVILAVLCSGILVNLRQVMLLNHEVKWIEDFRRSDPQRPASQKPTFLQPVARLLAGRDRSKLSLSAPTLRSLLDGIYLRLEETRDVSRYLIGLAIFLGLLGTFWGLLVTIRSVAEIIGSLGAGTDAVAMFATLKENLKQPLNGMATSFSTSLFGLASSLVLGFLDLQAGHAQNRFYNELEEWLSSMTRLPTGSLALETDAAIPAYVQALLEQTADGLERMQRAIVENERERRGGNEQLAELNAQLARLTDLLSREGRERQTQSEVHEELKTLLRALAHNSAPATQLSDDLRHEFRLLSRTIAVAMDNQRALNG